MVKCTLRRSFAQRGIEFKARNSSEKRRAKKRRAWVRERRKLRQGVRSGNGKCEKLKKRGKTKRHKKKKEK